MFPKHLSLPAFLPGADSDHRAGGGVLSDVEDPRPALKDGGGVRGELGPHQMFLSREREQMGQSTGKVLRDGTRGGSFGTPPPKAQRNESRLVGMGCQRGSGRNLVAK